MADGVSETSEATAAFEYDELPGPKAFRLVRIVDSSVENMISLVMATFQMSDVTEYIATSYTCGQPYRDINNPEAAEIPPVRDHMVLLNDRPILIYKNLYDFLSFLDKNNRPGPLWIDALCIAQDNEVEKAAQIMLGHFRRFAHIVKEYRWFDGGDAAIHLGLDLAAISIPFNVVSLWAIFIFATESEQMKSPEVCGQDLDLLRVAGQWQTIDFSAGWIIWLLTLTRELRSTHKKDKLYSLLGMIKRLSGFPVKDYILADPNMCWQELYTNVTATIMIKAGSLDPLDMVESRKTLKTIDGLPSWVPDYIAAQGHTAFHSLDKERTPVEQLFNASRWPKDGDPPFRISGSTIIAHAGMVDAVVGVCAIEIGHKANGIGSLVRFVKDVAKSTDAEFDRHIVWKTLLANECLDKAVDEAKNTDALYAESFRHLCITMCMWYLLPQSVLRTLNIEALITPDSDEQKRIDLMEILAIVSDGILSFNKWTLEEVEERAKFVTDAAAAAKASEVVDVVETSRALISAAYGIDKPLQLFLERAAQPIQGRCLCITSQGKLVLAPLYAAVGDQVFVLHRSRSLQVLRPTSTENEFNYVGAAYIEGCMRGELMRGPNSLEKDFHEIRIV